MISVRKIYTISDFIRFYGWFFIALCVQVLFWSRTWYITPSMETLPNVPGEKEARALALGDEQFYFRWHAFDLQNAGWTYGRAPSLRDFDYRKVYYWFKLLDTMDSESNFVPSIASYYFSRSGKGSDIRYIVRYLNEYSSYRLGKKWWWQAEAVHLADHKLNDGDLALQMAIPLQHLRNAPIIIRELPAFIYERRGEMGEARRVIDEIKADTDLPQGELNFLDYFVGQRLKKRDPQTLYYDQRQKVE